MILLFLIVFSFILYTLVFSFKKTKTVLSINIFCINCVLVTLSFVVFLVKKKMGLYEVPLGILFSIMIGPFLLLLLREDIKKSYLNFVFVICIELFGLGGYFLLQAFYPGYLGYLHQTLILAVIISCICYASYGYLYFINHHMRYKTNEVIIFYIVLLFSCSFFFGIVFFKRDQKIFDSDYIFMVYSLCVVIVALLNELKQVYYTDRLVSAESLKTNSQLVLVDVEQNLGLKEIVFEEISIQEKDVIYVEETSTALTDEVRDEIRQLLYKKIIENQLFLDPELTLTEASVILGIDKKTLLSYFRQSESLSFKQYINRLKVEYSVFLILEKEKDITVEELTTACGFNTRISFYRAFVNVYGFAPSELLTE